MPWQTRRGLREMRPWAAISAVVIIAIITVGISIVIMC
jgi:hypothetical protein